MKKKKDSKAVDPQYADYDYEKEHPEINFEPLLLEASKTSREDFLLLLQEAIDQDIMRKFSKNTFQLLHDMIADKIRLPNHRPSNTMTRRLQISRVLLLFGAEIKKPGMTKMKAYKNIEEIEKKIDKKRSGVPTGISVRTIQKIVSGSKVKDAKK